jgi:hypothetical protein
VPLEDLLVEMLIREVKERNLYKHFQELLEIPAKYFSLIYTDIISESNKGSNLSENQNLNTSLWISLGQWLGLKWKDGSIQRKHVRQHIRLKWKKLKHAMDLHNSKNIESIQSTAIARKTREEKTQLIMLARNLQSLDGIINFKFMVKPECITDYNNQTLVHLEWLDNYEIIIQATEAVHSYYYHILENPSH